MELPRSRRLTGRLRTLGFEPGTVCPGVFSPRCENPSGRLIRQRQRISTLSTEHPGQGWSSRTKTPHVWGAVLLGDPPVCPAVLLTDPFCPAVIQVI